MLVFVKSVTEETAVDAILLVKSSRVEDSAVAAPTMFQQNGLPHSSFVLWCASAL